MTKLVFFQTITGSYISQKILNLDEKKENIEKIAFKNTNITIPHQYITLQWHHSISNHWLQDWCFKIVWVNNNENIKAQNHWLLMRGITSEWAGVFRYQILDADVDIAVAGTALCELPELSDCMSFGWVITSCSVAVSAQLEFDISCGSLSLACCFYGSNEFMFLCHGSCVIIKAATHSLMNRTTYAFWSSFDDEIYHLACVN